MKKKLFILLLLFFVTAEHMIGQSMEKNYIQTHIYTDASGVKYQNRIDYYDAQGRPEQSILVGASPFGNDLTTLMEYDIFGRRQRIWLPAEMTDGIGTYAPFSVLKSRSQSSNSNDSKPYSLVEYEMSPLGRPLRQYGAGNDWYTKGKSTNLEYLTNNADDIQLNCIHYTLVQPLSADTIVTIRNGGTYPSGSLIVTRTKDEDDHVTLEFKDRLGQVVLTRALLGNDCIDTYYVYDDWGKLHAVLPPNLIEFIAVPGGTFSNLSSTAICKLAYLYVYDYRNLVVGKRLPGQGWTRIVYDRSDYPVFTQDSRQRSSGEWSFSLSDTFSRVCLTGISKNSFTGVLPSLSSVVKVVRDNSTGIYKGYSISGITLSSPQVLSVNYYDDYTFMGSNGFPPSTDSQYRYNALTGYGTFYPYGSQSLLTGTLTAMLGDTDSQTYLHSVNYYDFRGRLVQRNSENILAGGMDIEHFSYDFIGNILKKRHIHSATDKATHTETCNYIYDPMSRPLIARHDLNGRGEVTLMDNSYDRLGRLITNRRNDIAELKSEYTYNVRSWLKKINGPSFCQILYYNDLRSNGTNSACYNGDISGMDWNVNISDDKINRGYDYSYDQLSRLTGATYLEENVRRNYFDTRYYYDSQGNLLELQRRGRAGNTVYGLIDDLSFTLDGNHLTRVDDKATIMAYNGTFEFKDAVRQANEYAYDANGNLTKDLNKGITEIQYNVLNLPNKIIFSDGSTITYIYAADGKKLCTMHAINGTTTTTNYCGNVIYENGIAKLLLTEVGYVTLNDGKYYYYLQDYQGNNRVVINQNGTVEETNHYYPFGGKFAGLEDIQFYKYNSKELDTKKGLNWHDYGARYYDAALGRWNVMEPKFDKYYNISPYTFCLNNPMKYIDPNGEKIVDTHGNVIYTYNGGWSENAPQDAVRLGNSMMLTRIGTTQFNKMVDVDYGITLNISSKSKISQIGNIQKYTLGQAEKVLDSDSKIKSAKITIYEGTLNDYLRTAQSPKAKLYRTSTQSREEAIGAIGTHESIHVTDKQNIKESIENKIQRTSHDVEKIPNEAEKGVLRELFNKNHKL